MLLCFKNKKIKNIVTVQGPDVLILQTKVFITGDLVLTYNFFFKYQQNSSVR